LFLPNAVYKIDEEVESKQKNYNLSIIIGIIMLKLCHRDRCKPLWKYYRTISYLSIRLIYYSL
jgi:hypothetical protein